MDLVQKYCNAPKDIQRVRKAEVNNLLRGEFSSLLFWIFWCFRHGNVDLLEVVHAHIRLRRNYARTNSEVVAGGRRRAEERCAVVCGQWCCAQVSHPEFDVSP